jgi:hypothetical protein
VKNIDPGLRLDKFADEVVGRSCAERRKADLAWFFLGRLYEALKRWCRIG